MQTVVIIPENEYKQLIERIENLEKFREDSTRSEEIFYSTAEAAKLLRMSEVGVRKARREKRLKGHQRNGKEWEFAGSELERFQNRYKRPT